MKKALSDASPHSSVPIIDTLDTIINTHCHRVGCHLTPVTSYSAISYARKYSASPMLVQLAKILRIDGTLAGTDKNQKKN